MMQVLWSGTSKALAQSTTCPPLHAASRYSRCRRVGQGCGDAVLCRAANGTSREHQVASENDITLRFLDWFREGGGEGLTHDGKTSDGAAEIFVSACRGRGLRALRHISQGETVLAVPLALTLSDRKAPFPGATWHCRIAAQLFEETLQEAQSPMQPYLDMLPKAAVGAQALTRSTLEQRTAAYMPLLALYDQHVQMLEQQRQEYARFYREEGKAWVTDHDKLFEWALSMSCSRTFSVLMQMSESHLLVPGVDLCNHSHVPNLSYLADVHTKSFKLLANRNISPGEELTICYEEEANNDPFVVFFGFTPQDPHNPSDSCILWPTLSGCSLYILHVVNGLGKHQLKADLPSQQSLETLITDEWEISDEEAVSIDRNGVINEDVLRVLSLVLQQYVEPGEDECGSLVVHALKLASKEMLDRFHVASTSKIAPATIVDQSSVTDEYLEEYRKGKIECLRAFIHAT